MKCTLKHIETGKVFAEGVGSCSTMEAKYRYRTGPGDMTDIKVPKSYWDSRKDDPSGSMKILRDLANKDGINGKKFGTKKDEDGQWYITTASEKVEHDNPADYYNTVLKMAKKRAHVDAVLTATAASDIFTQDVEDMVPEIPSQAAPATAPPSAPNTDSKEPSESTESEVTEFIPSAILKKDGETKGKPWTRYTILEGETKYITFSESFAKLAKAASINGKPVKVWFKTGKYGRDIESLIDPAAEQREPGSDDN
jgi:tellurite resistance-related uncharacterized protein